MANEIPVTGFKINTDIVTVNDDHKLTINGEVIEAGSGSGDEVQISLQDTVQAGNGVTYCKEKIVTGMDIYYRPHGESDYKVKDMEDSNDNGHEWMKDIIHGAYMSYSHDGSKVAYRHKDNHKLYVKNSNDDDVGTCVTVDHDDVLWPSWSKDGTKISYRFEKILFWKNAFEVADGTACTPDEDVVTFQHWHNDGDKIYYQDGHSKIRLTSINDTNAGTEQKCTISQDGNLFAITSDGNWLYTINGGSLYEKDLRIADSDGDKIINYQDDVMSVKLGVSASADSEHLYFVNGEDEHKILKIARNDPDTRIDTGIKTSDKWRFRFSAPIPAGYYKTEGTDEAKNDLLGFAKAAGTQNEVIQMDVNRIYTTTGLKAGKKYYLGGAGAITTEEGGKYIGHAISSTQLLRVI